jgi:hypothetical protein
MRKDLAQLRERGTKFLGTLSMEPQIFRIMVEHGYSQNEHREGWDLALPVLGYNPRASSGGGAPSSQSEAITALDQWDEPNFARALAALQRLHPAQCEYVFRDGLTAAEGAAAIASVQTFKDRVVALRDGTDPGRAETREADKAAVETLAKRKIFDAEIETKLSTWLNTAKGVSLPTDASLENTPAFQAAARAFKAWLEDWRETARTTVTRRDYLIRLGLARRRSRKDGEIVIEEPLVVPPVPGITPEPREPSEPV